MIENITMDDVSAMLGQNSSFIRILRQESDAFLVTSSLYDTY
jgi:hypothetical protein